LNDNTQGVKYYQTRFKLPN